MTFRIPVLGFLLTACLSAAEQRPPNIVFIFADDMGWNDVSYQNRQGFIETPNIDALAKQGMTFSAAYAGAANCAPSRACLLSGQYPQRTGIYAVFNTSRGPMDKARLDPVPNTSDLRPSVTTMAEALKARGYVTGHFGKWHLGSYQNGTGPRQQGFDTSDDQLISPRGKKSDDAGNPDPKLMGAITAAAGKFITENKDRPFFAYIAHHAIHGPLEAEPATLARFKTKTESSGPHVKPLYAACTYDFDAAVGATLKTIADLGLADDTIVVFTSDNGGTPASINEPLRGAKGAYYEAGIRIPLVIRWPGHIEPGSTCAVPVINEDFYPTFVKAAGGTPDPALDGADLSPVFKSGATLARQTLFWQFPGYLDNPVPRGRDPIFRTRPVSVIRKGDWKLLLYHEEWLLDGGAERVPANGAVELYDLSKDPGEHTDLAATEPEKRGELLADLTAWLAATKAPMPVPKKNPPGPAPRR